MPLIRLTPETRGDVPEDVLWLVEVPVRVGEIQPEFFFGDASQKWLRNPRGGVRTREFDTTHRHARPAEPHEIPGEEGEKPLTFGRYMVEGGKAYRLLDAGDTKQEGDEFRNGNEWRATSYVGGPVIGPLQYRRPLPSTPATYALLQSAWCEAFNVKVGTRVRVVRKAEDEELGWDNWWVPEMDPSVGREMVVTDIHGREGVMLDDYCQFPFHVLEPLPEPTASVKDGVWQMDISQAEGSTDDATCPLLEPLPAQPPAPTDAKGVLARVSPEQRQEFVKAWEEATTRCSFGPLQVLSEGVTFFPGDAAKDAEIASLRTQLTALREAAVFKDTEISRLRGLLSEISSGCGKALSTLEQLKG